MNEIIPAEILRAGLGKVATAYRMTLVYAPDDRGTFWLLDCRTLELKLVATFPATTPGAQIRATAMNYLVEQGLL